MTKAELIARICEKAKITKAQADLALEATVEAVKVATDEGESLTLPHLGTFKRKALAARVARNPKTGAAINVPASSKLAFKQAAELKK